MHENKYHLYEPLQPVRGNKRMKKMKIALKTRLHMLPFCSDALKASKNSLFKQETCTSKHEHEVPILTQ